MSLDRHWCKKWDVRVLWVNFKNWKYNVQVQCYYKMYVNFSNVSRLYISISIRWLRREKDKNWKVDEADNMWIVIR